jgi:hypothetical protein
MSKWNAIFFTPEAAGNYSFSSYIAVGSLATVQSLMTLLYNYFYVAPPAPRNRYFVEGQDLSDIFAPLAGNVPPWNTGYKVDEVDLKYIYEPRRNVSDPEASPTGILVNGTDLNILFYPK